MTEILESTIKDTGDAESEKLCREIAHEIGERCTEIGNEILTKYENHPIEWVGHNGVLNGAATFLSSVMSCSLKPIAQKELLKVFYQQEMERIESEINLGSMSKCSH